MLSIVLFFCCNIILCFILESYHDFPNTALRKSKKLYYAFDTLFGISPFPKHNEQSNLQYIPEQPLYVYDDIPDDNDDTLSQKKPIRLMMAEAKMSNGFDLLKKEISLLMIYFQMNQPK